MNIHRLQYAQTIPADIQTAWAFFSDPCNLCRITPEWLCFDIRFVSPGEMYSGMIIEYEIRAIARISMYWLTEITHVKKPYFFVDEQRLGPYRFWHHQHLFHESSRGTEIIDLVHYALPFGRFSAPVHYFLVRPRLEQIFSFRHKALERIFGSGHVD